MSKFKDWRERVRCNFIGWDYDLLSQCGEASHRLLKIYVNAVTIIMIIWFVIGSVFSRRYIGITSICGNLFAGAIFALIVYMIERIIILHMGSKGIYVFRTLLAVSMAFIGAFIFDQLIFRNDLEEAIRMQEREKIKNEYREKKQSTSMELAELKAETDSLYAIYAAKPTITVTDVSTTKGVADSNGNRPSQTTIIRRQIDNPIKEQIAANEQRVRQFQQDVESYRNADIDKIVDDRIKNKKTGFLEELKASWSIITESGITIVFYIILTAVLLCLELFVVTLKWFKSKKCEYDLIVEHQLNVKSTQLQNAWRDINKKYVTQTLPDEKAK